MRSEFQDVLVQAASDWLRTAAALPLAITELLILLLLLLLPGRLPILLLRLLLWLLWKLPILLLVAMVL